MVSVLELALPVAPIHHPPSELYGTTDGTKVVASLSGG
jgi:hypothetical protein